MREGGGGGGAEGRTVSNIVQHQDVSLVWTVG